MPLTYFFSNQMGEKTIFHCTEIMCKVDLHILSLVKKNLKSKIQSSLEIYVCKISFSRISKPIVPNIDYVVLKNNKLSLHIKEID